MAKRDNETMRTSNDATTDASAGPAAGDALEQRVVAFAEQLGRIAGTVRAKAEGWMDRETLNKQVASVRDSAADLLEQLAGRPTKATASKKEPPAAKEPPPVAARRGTSGRSGGVVDAPGKKHRKPMPADPGASRVGSQAAKMRTARTMVKTNRRRGRG